MQRTEQFLYQFRKPGETLRIRKASARGPWKTRRRADLTQPLATPVTCSLMRSVIR
jgi:hypothetical protein